MIKVQWSMGSLYRVLKLLLSLSISVCIFFKREDSLLILDTNEDMLGIFLAQWNWRECCRLRQSSLRWLQGSWRQKILVLCFQRLVSPLRQYFRRIFSLFIYLFSYFVLFTQSCLCCPSQQPTYWFLLFTTKFLRHFFVFILCDVCAGASVLNFRKLFWIYPQILKLFV